MQISQIDSLCRKAGKIIIFSALIYSAAILLATAYSKSRKDSSLQERLRKSYEGLSPEEYETL
ncbi:MAG: hypothetical protein LBH29_05050 [Elusimicrobiota bacterium]|nr:hypothetical protein [Elusimicrobiota bacterium]